jgi:hypothetical protein
MAINFPTSPAVNDIYTYLGVDYKWNGEVWVPQLGTLPIANGGTGQTTAVEGFDALAPTTTQGDIIYRGASDNLRLAKGTANHVLTMGANDPAWAARFGWEIITNTAGSAVTTIDFTGLDALTQYSKFRLDIINVRPATDDVYLYLRVGTGATPTWQTGTVYDAMVWRSNAGGLSNGANAGIAQMAMFDANRVGNASNENISGFIEFILGGTNIYPNFISQATNLNASTLISTQGGGGVYRGGAITAVRLFWESGDFAAVGRVILSGQRTS